MPDRWPGDEGRLKEGPPRIRGETLDHRRTGRRFTPIINNGKKKRSPSLYLVLVYFHRFSHFFTATVVHFTNYVQYTYVGEGGVRRLTSNIA